MVIINHTDRTPFKVGLSVGLHLAAKIEPEVNLITRPIYWNKKNQEHKLIVRPTCGYNSEGR